MLLEKCLKTGAPRKAADIWSRLNDSDHWTRHAARVELESKPAGEWTERALTEARPTAAFTALLALSRCGERALQSRLVARVNELSSPGLSAEQKLIASRALSVSFIRQGRPDEEMTHRTLVAWEPMFPLADARVNQSLCELLVYLGSTNVVAKTIPLFASAATQEEKFHYLFTLRLVTNGWTLAERKTYFDWLRRARAEFNGANMLPTALNYIRADAESTLSANERDALKETLAALDQRTPAPAASVARQFVKEWTMNDFATGLEAVGRQRDAARGKKLFTETGCAQCHRLGSEGGFIGPDLTAVSSRFDRRTLLESLIEPSKVVAEVYRPVTITLKSGAIYDGRVVSEDAQSLMLAINPADPDQRRRLAKADIAAQRGAELSPMPAGLLDTLTREEILDLLAWTEAGGDTKHAHFRK